MDEPRPWNWLPRTVNVDLSLPIGVTLGKVTYLFHLYPIWAFSDDSVSW